MNEADLPDSDVEASTADASAAPAQVPTPGWNWEYLFFVPIFLLLGGLIVLVSAGLCSVMHPILAIPLGIVIGTAVFGGLNAANGGSTLMEMGCGSLIPLILGVFLYPVFVQARDKARQKTCVQNLKQIDTALRAYAQDNDGLLPPTDGWQTRVTAYLGTDKEGNKIGPKVFRCPTTAQEAKTSYGLNPAMAGVRPESLSQRDANNIPLVYDSDDGRLPAHPGCHSLSGKQDNNVLFVSGQVK